MSVRHTNVPPCIMDGKIELFGHKGREIYSVKSVYFYSCKNIFEECVHDISMLYEDTWGNMYYFDICDVKYDDLVRQNYILYLKESNKNLLNIGYYECCKLNLLPIVK